LKPPDTNHPHEAAEEHNRTSRTRTQRVEILSVEPTNPSLPRVGAQPDAAGRPADRRRIRYAARDAVSAAAVSLGGSIVVVALWAVSRWLS
jgi:hypothetical protein